VTTSCRRLYAALGDTEEGAHFQVRDAFFRRGSRQKGQRLGHAAAFSAKTFGVSLLEGSLMRSRAKFWESAMTVPRRGLFRRPRDPAREAGQHNRVNGLSVLSLGFVFVGFKVRGESASAAACVRFDGFVSRQKECELLDGARLKVAQGGPGDLASTRGRFFALPCSH